MTPGTDNLSPKRHGRLVPAPSRVTARTHALVDDNKRLALATTLASLGMNGQR